MTTGQADVLQATDAERAIATITTAFSSDPVTRWVLPDPADYLSYWPRIVRPFGGGAFEHGSADAVSGFGGVALWLPPGVGSDDETMGAVASEAVPDERKETVFGFMAQMAEFHPHEPHWYLPLIGVDPAQQGRGLGSALLSHALERADRDRLPAYLEATTPRNKALYERHGFAAMGVIQHADSPPMWPMLRRAR